MKENSIEEDITRIKQRIEDVKEYIEYGLAYSEYLDLENSFDNILSDYKRVLKENEELEEINNELEAEKNEAIRRYNFETIPKQKVKDKIEEYKNMLKTCNKAQDIDRIKAINERVLELQEILGSEE